MVDGAAARFDPAGGWDAAELFETGGDVSDACAAMGPGGNGWAIFTAVGALRARRDDPGLGWQAVQPLGWGIATDADTNGTGLVLAVGHGAYYQSNPPAFLDAARGIVYVP
jgi:hypothetical protein